MSKHHKLIVDYADPDFQEYEYVIERADQKASPTMYVKGPYMACEEVNRNKRKYIREEMEKEVDRYRRDIIETNRATGELNHPEGIEIDLKNCCHKILEINQDGNVFYGRSKVLSGPSGMILQSLINDGVQVGMSTRSLGKLEESSGVSTVRDMRLITVDCVADPSCPKAWVNGILESKQFVVDTYGEFEEVYDTFEEGLQTLPKKHLEQFLKERIIDFINDISVKA